MRKTTILRNSLKDNKLLKFAGVYDGLDAIIAERSGFDGVWASGLCISASHGLPDSSILTMSDFLKASIIINDSVGLPVIADCDSGFGDIQNVIRMIKKYESNNIAAICIEDKMFPKRNSFHKKEQKLQDPDLFSSMIWAAKKTQKDPDFMVIARLEGFICGLALEEVLKRANQYVDAGADMILVHSKIDNLSQVESFCKSWNWRTPLAVIPTTYYDVHFSELEALGVSISIYANQALRGRIKTTEEVFKKILSDGTTKNLESSLTTIKDVFELQGVEKYEAIANTAIGLWKRE